MKRSAVRLLTSLLVLAGLLSGCGGEDRAAPSQGAATEIRYQGWGNQVTLPELAADLGYLPNVRLTWIGNTISGPQDIQATATGEIDVGGAVDGAVAKLVPSGAPIQD